MPLTVCPFSNVKLRVVDTLEQHPLATMLEHGLCATVNSDDPAYFGGYVGENLAGVAEALRLDDDTLVQLARNSFEASFLDDATRARPPRPSSTPARPHSRAKTMSCAPCQRVISPSGRRFSLPSNTVRKWLPASWPTMLENMQPPYGQEDLGLAEAAGVEQDLAGRRVARVVLEADADVEVAERDPGRLAAPAHVDDLLLERQQLRERLARLGRALLLEAGAEACTGRR